MTEHWLADYLKDSTARQLCTWYGCTTCGAMPFRSGVWTALAKSMGVDSVDPKSRETRIALIRAMATLPHIREYENAISLLVQDMHEAGDPSDSEFGLMIQGTWAGDVLASMIGNEAFRREKWEEHLKLKAEEHLKLKAESQRLREEKKVKHQERLEAKKARDQQWREDHPNGRSRLIARTEVVIQSRDYWFKIADSVHQDWALVDNGKNEVRVWFFDETGGVFDQLKLASMEEACRGLLLNGFRRYASEKEAVKLIETPKPPFHRKIHPNGPIYSSGRHWK